MSSDVATIVRVLSAQDWVFIPPSAQRSMQDEVHDAAREEIARRDLPDTTPYGGWHAQAKAADRDGNLSRPQRLYFGGDLDRVRAAVAALEPHGFAIFGGRTDGESFQIVRDASPTAADPAQLSDWRIRLRLLTDTSLTVGTGPDSRPSPLREGEEDLLRDVLAHPDLGDLWPDALRALHQRGLARVADVDRFADTWTQAFDGSTVDYARVALAVGAPGAGDVVAQLQADGEATSELLLAWGDPRALDAAYSTAHGGVRADVGVYLDLAEAAGQSRSGALVRLATDLHSTGSGLGDIPYLVPATRPDADTSPWDVRALAAITDPALPVWLRASVAEKVSRLGLSLRADIAHATWEGSPQASRERPPADLAPAEALALLTQWDDAVARVLPEAGRPPWPGFAVADSLGRQWAHEHLTTLDDAAADALRAHLARPDTSEVELATCLELLAATGHLRVADLEPLRSGWRKRLLVKPDDYSPARPAIVTAATAWWRAGDPLGQQVVDVVLADTRQWGIAGRNLLRGEVAAAGLGGGAGVDPDGAATHLWAAAMSGEKGSAGAALAWVTLDVARYGHSPATAVAGAWDFATGMPYRRRGLLQAALQVGAEGGPMARSAENSVRQVRTAVASAEDPGQRPEVRRAALTWAAESTVLRYPTGIRPVPPTYEVVAELRDRIAAARVTLPE